MRWYEYAKPRDRDVTVRLMRLSVDDWSLLELHARRCAHVPKSRYRSSLFSRCGPLYHAVVACGRLCPTNPAAAAMVAGRCGRFVCV